MNNRYNANNFIAGRFIRFLLIMLFLGITPWITGCIEEVSNVFPRQVSDDDLVVSLSPRIIDGPTQPVLPEMPLPNRETHWLEAEHANNISLPMTIGNDSSASEGAFLWVSDVEKESGGRASFTFKINDPGTYAIWGRVSGLNGSSNSFHAKINDSGPFIWSFSSGIWHWERLNLVDETHSVFYLTCGTQTLEIIKREKGAKLDKILITNDLDYSPTFAESLDIGNAWSGQAVQFSLFTGINSQFVAYYDENRQMTIASRTLNESKWSYQKLDSFFGWDSHNYITMSMDLDNQLHVTGNMHCDPLYYLKTKATNDIGSLTWIGGMLGVQERRVTYPTFFYFKGYLAFHYRNGSAGNGETFFNVFIESQDRWFRFNRESLFDGAKNSSYFLGPVKDANGVYHIVWMWRSNSDAATCHNLSHVQSVDLIHWETSRSTSITLPISVTTGSIIDPVPSGGGLLNTRFYMGFDSQNRLIVTYHKYDEMGFSQIYNARLENGDWHIYQMSHWRGRWDFGGGGSLPALIPGQAAVELEDDGSLTQAFNGFNDHGVWLLDEDSLSITGYYIRQHPRWIPRVLYTLETKCMECIANQESMRVKFKFSDYQYPLETPDKFRYYLRWESLGANRDRPRSYTPPTSKLRLYTSVPFYLGEPAENLP